MRLFDLTTATLLLCLTVGCKTRVEEPAPVQGGEYLTYHIVADSLAIATVRIEADGLGFVVKAEGGGWAPQRVAADLTDGRSEIKAFHLGKLWLPLSQRKVGTKTPLGEVVHVRIRNGRRVVVIRRRPSSPVVEHYFLEDSGFLIGMQMNLGGRPYVADLVDTNILGIK